MNIMYFVYIMFRLVSSLVFVIQYVFSNPVFWFFKNLADNMVRHANDETM
jgi:hypothetical protein